MPERERPELHCENLLNNAYSPQIAPLHTRR
jgi:hypothetical protein